MLAQNLADSRLWQQPRRAKTPLLKGARMHTAECSMHHTVYRFGKLNPYILEYPVGTPDEVADMIYDFKDIARVIIGLSKFKIFGFGPRPYDFGMQRSHKTVIRFRRRNNGEFRV